MHFIYSLKDLILLYQESLKLRFENKIHVFEGLVLKQNFHRPTCQQFMVTHNQGIMEMSQFIPISQLWSIFLGAHFASDRG